MWSAQCWKTWSVNLLCRDEIIHNTWLHMHADFMLHNSSLFICLSIMECMEYALLQSCSVNLNMSKSAYMVMLVRQIRWKFVHLLYHQWTFYIATFKKKKKSYTSNVLHLFTINQAMAHSTIATDGNFKKKKTTNPEFNSLFAISGNCQNAGEFINLIG